jgi:hypothetical protein
LESLSLSQKSCAGGGLGVVCRYMKPRHFLTVFRVVISAGLGLGMAVAALIVQPMSAHHAFSAEFDANKVVTLKGSVTKLDWRNPHIWVYLAVKNDKNDKGGVDEWQCEGGAPNTLTRNGWSKDSLKSGDPIIIEGYLAKDASKTCNMRLVKMPDGRDIFAGSTAGDGLPTAAKTPGRGGR